MRRAGSHHFVTRASHHGGGQGLYHGSQMNPSEQTLNRLQILIENAQRAGFTEQQISRVVEEELGGDAPPAPVALDEREQAA
jgi:hypothetical protein